MAIYYRRKGVLMTKNFLLHETPEHQQTGSKTDQRPLQREATLKFVAAPGQAYPSVVSG